MVDGKGRITFVNPRIETLFGYKPAELLGNPVETLIPDRYRGQHVALRGSFSRHPETRPMGAGRDLYGRRKNGTEFPVEIGLNAVNKTGNPAGQDDDLILATVVDITARKKSEEHVRFIMRELAHRTKNILAVVQVMSWQTARTCTSLEDFEERFTQRIDALSCSHDLLANKEWEGAAVADLVKAQLAPFLDNANERLHVHGPSLLLKPDAAQNLGLALHELATNASKYGALSHPSGRIKVVWTIDGTAGAPRRFRIDWHENGGPEVRPPTRTGFGHSIIKEIVARAFTGEVTLKFEPEGFIWQLTAPADRMFAENGETVDNETMEEDDMNTDLLRGQRILVVEDDALLAMSVDAMLQEAGADIIGPAATLDRASTLAAADKLSGAILDIRLNGDEVWPVARLLAKNDVPFMFYSGHYDSATLPAEWAGRPILTKPARPRQIVGALASLIALH